MFVRPSVSLFGAGVHYDHTVHFSPDMSLWLHSPMFRAPWHQRMSTYSQPSFSSFTWKRGGVWMCKLGVISQERLKIEVKLLLSANRKSYMPRGLVQQWMTLSDLEVPFTRIARYLCDSWASCFSWHRTTDYASCSSTFERTLNTAYPVVLYYIVYRHLLDGAGMF